ncbi:hypothetical protein K439DRAFT_1611896 [Ramaria rubella]|nr:hypothetical protein K439DRAFT_1611896 [Ramaria rubella]
MTATMGGWSPPYGQLKQLVKQSFTKVFELKYQLEGGSSFKIAVWRFLQTHEIEGRKGFKPFQESAVIANEPRSWRKPLDITKDQKEGKRKQTEGRPLEQPPRCILLLGKRSVSNTERSNPNSELSSEHKSAQKISGRQEGSVNVPSLNEGKGTPT